MTQCFLDSHCHLDDSDFDADRETVIERARAAGLKYLVTIGCGKGPDDLDVGVPIAARHDWIYTTAGIHPHEAVKAEERHFEKLRTTLANSKVLAVGEIGLDYFYDHSPRETQKQVFVRQLEIAAEARRPIVIHARDAWDDLREIVQNHWRPSGLGGILHCFTGTRQDAFRFMDWGFMISIAGPVTFKKADELRSTVATIPLDRLLTETDSPYLAPVPNRGKRNEPSFVVEVTRALGALHHLSAEQMGAQAIGNFECFFNLA